MVSKSTSILLAVAVVAVSAVAIIGLGYAYTAATENSGNTTGVTYITLTPNEYGQTWTADYSGTFSNPVKYDTVKTSAGVTYKVNTDQIKDIYSSNKGILLGTTKIDIAPASGNVPAFEFSVARTAGTMVGDFIIGYSTNNSTYTYRAFSYDNASTVVNYYSTGNGDAVTDDDDAGTFDQGTTTVYVKLFYVVNAANPSSASTVEGVTPLTNVTFQFKAEVPEPQA